LLKQLLIASLAEYESKTDSFFSSNLSNLI
jgi:hypothetical protein